MIDRLVESGHVTWRRTSRRAQARRCKCGAGVVSGLDGRAAALDIDADPVALSEVGVLAARLAGRRVVGLAMGSARPELFRTSATEPPWGCVLVPVHVCGERVPDGWRAPVAPRAPEAPVTVEPPF
jgi:hypothetical protein